MNCGNICWPKRCPTILWKWPVRRLGPSLVLKFITSCSTGFDTISLGIPLHFSRTRENLCYSQVHNKRGGGGGVKMSWGGFKDWWGQNIKEKRRKLKIGLSLLSFVTSLSTSVFLVNCGAAYTNETSRVYDIFMNFCVVPREIREIK